MIYLRYDTASQEIPLGPFVDSTDGNTEETGLTIANTDIKLWKAGATTLANKNSGGATHISNGMYYAVLDATDTNTLGSMRVYVHVSGALAVIVDAIVLPQKVYDSLIAGSDNLEIDLIQIAGSAVSTTSAQLGVNIVQVSGDATAADNAESFFDGTGYAGTNNTIPTVTTLTNAPSDSSGTTTLLSRITDTRAGYLDELGSANIPADIDTLIARLTSARAGYLDNLSAGAVALASVCDDILVDTGTTLPAQISGLNNLSSAQVTTAVDTALGTAVSEPTGISDKSIKGILWHLFSRFYHKNTQTASAQTTYKANGTTVLATRTASDDGTTQTLGAAE